MTRKYNIRNHFARAQTTAEEAEEATTTNNQSTVSYKEEVIMANKQVTTADSIKEENPFAFNITSFLSDADFKYLAATKHTAEEAIGWSLLSKNIIYHVDKLTPIQTKWGSRFIIQLHANNGAEFKVWCPSNIVRDLKSGFKLNGADCHAYLKSLGEKETDVPGESKKKYFDFETVYICV